jgi:hypothetical protein
MFVDESFKNSRSDREGRLNLGISPWLKNTSLHSSAEMITGKIAVVGLEIVVRRDHAFRLLTQMPDLDDLGG